MIGTPRPFTVDVDDSNGTPIVRVAGEVDMDTAPRLEQRLLQLAHDGAPLITVDLAELDFIDSTGLHALVVALKELRAYGGDLVLRSPSPSTARVLELSGLSTVVKVL
jgi:anti-anti-sigma factor